MPHGCVRQVGPSLGLKPFSRILIDHLYSFHRAVQEAAIYEKGKSLGTWKRHFVLPGMPDDMKGQHRCRLDRATFDPLIKLFALYMKEPDSHTNTAKSLRLI